MRGIMVAGRFCLTCGFFIACVAGTGAAMAGTVHADVAALRSRDSGLVNEAIESLARQPEGIAPLLDFVRTTRNRQHLNQAVQALAAAEAGPDGPTLQEACMHGRNWSRLEAVTRAAVLWRGFRSDPQVGSPPLLVAVGVYLEGSSARLSAEDPAFDLILRALPHAGVADRFTVVPGLIRQLAAPEPEVRVKAAECLHVLSGEPPARDPRAPVPGTWADLQTQYRDWLHRQAAATVTP